MTNTYSHHISKTIAKDNKHVSAVLKLLNERCTVHFIARYRKEATGSMDEICINKIKTLYENCLQLDKRREFIKNSLTERNLLLSDLENAIDAVVTLTELEDLYIPYKQKKRTRATIAREKGLEPLAKLILSQSSINLKKEALKFVSSLNGVDNVNEAIAGAGDIIAEEISENIQLKNRLREYYFSFSRLSSSVIKSKIDEGEKYRDYFSYSELQSKASAHRILAVLRGKGEGILTVKIDVDLKKAASIISKHFIINSNECASFIQDIVIPDALKRLIHPSIENEIISNLKEKADSESIKVFSNNIKELLLQPPLHGKNILAMDPGFRSGVKIACLNAAGELLFHDTIHPHTSGDNQSDYLKVKTLCEKYRIGAVAIGNGTAGRETELFIKNINLSKDILIVMVNESGASVYSVSDIARDEFPELDVTVRGTISIGRRLIDPLAELVKVDPKSIGVGQYQHDVDQKALKGALDFTVESCVNSVGVELNTASKELLQYVSGIGPVLAQNIIDYRKEHGVFKSKNELKKVKRFGEHAFQQSAGFLRVNDSLNILDRTSVHPEHYHIIKQFSSDLSLEINEIVCNTHLRKIIDLSQYVNESIGLPTLNDILDELEKPGRDPRKEFELFSFTDGVNKIDDIKLGMELNGIVTNVTNFGAFIDVGVHQDGLIHISQLADKFVSNPLDIVSVNMKVKARQWFASVLETVYGLGVSGWVGHLLPKATLNITSA